VELYLHSPIRLHGVMFSEGEHRDNFTFTFYLYLYKGISGKVYQLAHID
jgi:hypothetical protein